MISQIQLALLFLGISYFPKQSSFWLCRIRCVLASIANLGCLLFFLLPLYITAISIKPSDNGALIFCQFKLEHYLLWMTNHICSLAGNTQDGFRVAGEKR